MILEKGNMWDVFIESDLWLFTGNSYINQNGELVMGRGLALEVKNRFPALPKELGGYICDMNDGHLGCYGLIPWLMLEYSGMIGVFQVKRHFRDNARLSLIGHSCVKLMSYLNRNNNMKPVDLNFPGIGYGRLDREQVLPIISELPDIVHVWEKNMSTISRLKQGACSIKTDSQTQALVD